MSFHHLLAAGAIAALLPLSASALSVEDIYAQTFSLFNRIISIQGQLIQSLDANIADLKSKLSSANNELSATKGERSSVSNALSTTKAVLSSVNSQLSDSQKQLSTANTNLAVAQSDLATTKTQLKSTQDELIACRTPPPIQPHTGEGASCITVYGTTVPSGTELAFSPCGCPVSSNPCPQCLDFRQRVLSCTNGQWFVNGVPLAPSTLR